MAKCSLCGKETQAFKINEGGQWNWYCGDCYHAIEKETKARREAGGKVSHKKMKYGMFDNETIRRLG